MTYSLVAFDPDTGEHGAAVQSHWFSVGSLCAFARPGVGAVATQSVVEPAYGPRGLGPECWPGSGLPCRPVGSSSSPCRGAWPYTPVVFSH